MITSTASCVSAMVLLLLRGSAAHGDGRVAAQHERARATPVRRRAAGRGSSRSSSAERLGELHAGQRRARGRSAGRPRTPGAGWGRGPDAKVSGVRRTRPGRGSPPRAAPRSSDRARRSRRRPRPRSVAVRSKSCSAESNRSISSTHGRRPGPAAGPRRPARSMRHQAVAEHVDRRLVPGVEQQHRRGDHLVLGEPRRRRPAPRPGRETRSSRGAAARAVPARGSCPRTRSAAVTAASTTACVGRRLVHPHDRLRPGPQLRARARAGRPSSSAMTRTGSGSAYSPTTSKPAGSTSVEQRRGQLAHPRPQPLDVAAVERADDEPAQPRVLRRLVLHHLVAVQQVERLERGRPAAGRVQIRPSRRSRSTALARRVVEGEVRRRDGSCHADAARAGAPRRRTGRGRRPPRAAVRSTASSVIGTERVGQHLAHRPDPATTVSSSSCGTAVLEQQLAAAAARHDHVAVAVDADQVGQPAAAAWRAATRPARTRRTARRRTTRSRRCSRRPPGRRRRAPAAPTG